MRLTDIYAELVRSAQRSGQDRGHTFSGGARIAVRVAGKITTLTISRSGKLVGDTELITFKRDCGVPPHARRIPDVGQARRLDDAGQAWHYVAYCWQEDAQ